MEPKLGHSATSPRVRDREDRDSGRTRLQRRSRPCGQALPWNHRWHFAHSQRVILTKTTGDSNVHMLISPFSYVQT